jgi:ubiquinone/menaquinone biosynthesis C-methylase UbiE
MTDSQRDIWSEWLLNRRFGGDPKRMNKMLSMLYPVRDRVLSHVDLKENQTLLDVGCGDGLIAFGALEKFDKCQVVFSDISADLLDHAANLARKMNVEDRCQFVCVSADDLSAFKDNSIDAVTTRSVLIFVSARQQAFNEFQRILKPSGRLSIFEPISSFSDPEPSDRFMGYDITPVMEIAQKIKDVYDLIQPPGIDPMGNFDERDLLNQAGNAGFKEIHLELQANIMPAEIMDWQIILNTPWNPKVPSLAEAMEQGLTPQETEKFINHLRPLVESGQGLARSAVAYLWAVK